LVHGSIFPPYDYFYFDLYNFFLGGSLKAEGFGDSFLQSYSSAIPKLGLAIRVSPALEAATRKDS